jgi:hypothetical protein
LGFRYTNTAGLAFGGNTPTSPTAATESFNGTSVGLQWSSMNTARVGPAGGGTQTATVAFGGAYLGTPA